MAAPPRPEFLAARVRFAGLVHCYAPTAAPWLAVWLPPQVEAEVDHAFAYAPSLGLALDEAARETLMARVRRLSPAVTERECAPLPPRHARAEAELARAGLARLACGGLRARYAVLTWAPKPDNPAPGCQSCSLHAGCPRLSSKNSG